MSRTYKIFVNASNVNQVWNQSSIDERKKLLRSISIIDKQLIRQLVNNEYVNLDSEVRYKLECQ